MPTCPHCNREELPEGSELDPYLLAGADGNVHFVSITGVQAYEHPSKLRLEVGNKPYHLMIYSKDTNDLLGKVIYRRGDA
jgi:hypothetical protein